MVPQQPADTFNDPSMEEAYQQWKMEKMAADKAEQEIKIQQSVIAQQLPSYNAAVMARSKAEQMVPQQPEPPMAQPIPQEYKMAEPAP